MSRSWPIVTFFLWLALDVARAQPPGAGEEGRRHRVPDCPDCLLWIPRTPVAGERPLVIALHGDGAAPRALLALLQGEAQRRGALVFAPQCSPSLGCTAASWWRWASSSAWLTQQVRHLIRAYPVDVRRIYLLGWSGGASFLASSLAELPPLFAGVGLVGGGMPARGTCPSEAVPVYFVSGTRNPLRRLAEAARDHLRACPRA